MPWPNSSNKLTRHNQIKNCGDVQRGYWHDNQTLKIEMAGSYTTKGQNGITRTPLDYTPLGCRKQSPPLKYLQDNLSEVDKNISITIDAVRTIASDTIRCLVSPSQKLLIWICFGVNEWVMLADKRCQFEPNLWPCR